MASLSLSLSLSHTHTYTHTHTHPLLPSLPLSLPPSLPPSLQDIMEVRKYLRVLNGKTAAATALILYNLGSGAVLGERRAPAGGGGKGAVPADLLG